MLSAIGMVNCEERIQTISLRLHNLSSKLRVLSYLVEKHQVDGSTLLDIDEIHFGLGTMMAEIAQQMRIYSEQLENLSLRTQKLSKSPQ